MKKESFNIKNAILLGGALASDSIGTAFASGQECRSYFSSWGMISFVGLIIFGILFTYQNAELFAFGYDSKTDRIKGTYQYCCGKYFGKIMDIMLPVFLFCIMTIMCSGAGALFEAFGLSHMVGTVVIIIIIFLTVLLDMKKIISILGSVGLIIIVAAIAVCILSVVTGHDMAIADDFLMQHADEVSHAENNWLYSAIAYSTLVPGTAVPFFSEMGRNASSRKEAIWGAIIGTVLVVLADILLNAAILSNIKTVYNIDMPVLQLAIHMSSILGLAFSVILLMGMYSTAVPMLWMICDAVPAKKPEHKKIAAGIICVLLLVFSQVKLDTLINTMYPIMGYFTMLFFFLIIVRHIRNVLEKKKAAA